jgi:hypothetical protein
MTFTMRVRDGIVIACRSELGPVPMELCEISEAVSAVFNLMTGREFDIEFHA